MPSNVAAPSIDTGKNTLHMIGLMRSAQSFCVKSLSEPDCPRLVNVSPCLMDRSRMATCRRPMPSRSVKGRTTSMPTRSRKLSPSHSGQAHRASPDP